MSVVQLKNIIRREYHNLQSRKKKFSNFRLGTEYTIFFGTGIATHINFISKHVQFKTHI